MAARCQPPTGYAQGINPIPTANDLATPRQWIYLVWPWAISGTDTPTYWVFGLRSSQIFDFLKMSRGVLTKQFPDTKEHDARVGNANPIHTGNRALGPGICSEGAFFWLMSHHKVLWFGVASQQRICVAAKPAAQPRLQLFIGPRRLYALR